MRHFLYARGRRVYPVLCPKVEPTSLSPLRNIGLESAASDSAQRYISLEGTSPPSDHPTLRRSLHLPHRRLLPSPSLPFLPPLPLPLPLPLTNHSPPCSARRSIEEIKREPRPQQPGNEPRTRAARCGTHTARA